MATLNDLLSYLKDHAGGYLIRVHWFTGKMVFEIHPRSGVSLHENVRGHGWIHHQPYRAFELEMLDWEISGHAPTSLLSLHDQREALIATPMREFEEAVRGYLQPR